MNEKGADNLDEEHFNSMEFCKGTLSRKIDLEAGGNRNSNRSWTSFYSVLKGSNISFYKSAEKASDYI